MSSALWLLLYLAPLLGLTAAVFAWFGWHWRGNGVPQRIAELQTQIDDAQKVLRTAEADCDNARSQVIIATAAANTLREQTEDELRTLREDLTAAHHETRQREDEAAKARETSQALEAELARLLRDLDLLRTERAQAAAAQTEPAQPVATGSTPVEIETPAAKPKRKRTTAAKPKTTAAVPASLHEKTAALVNELAQLQSTVATLTQEHDDWQRRVAKLEEKSPANAAGLGLARRSLTDSEKRLNTATAAIEHLQNQARVLHRTQATAATLAAVADDDLTQIKGIKKIISEQLRAHGVRTWRQIAQWDDDELRAFSELLAFKNRATREQWQAQARTLHEAAHGPL